jgi:hypothetical protein
MLKLLCLLLHHARYSVATIRQIVIHLQADLNLKLLTQMENNNVEEASLIFQSKFLFSFLFTLFSIAGWIGEDLTTFLT